MRHNKKLYIFAVQADVQKYNCAPARSFRFEFLVQNKLLKYSAAPDSYTNFKLINE